jgi:hypothetical protein
VKVATDEIHFRKHMVYTTCIIYFRVTNDNGSHADLEVQATADGTSHLMALLAYRRARKAQRDLIEKYRKV